VEHDLRSSNTAISRPTGGLTIFDNTGLVVPELDADGLPPPGTRLRKGMALYVMPRQANRVLAHNEAQVQDGGHCVGGSAGRSVQVRGGGHGD
jgi:hypothetical protein